MFVIHSFHLSFRLKVFYLILFLLFENVVSISVKGEVKKSAFHPLFISSIPTTNQHQIQTVLNKILYFCKHT